MLDLITLGETLVAFMPVDHSSILHGNSFTKKIAGAESNVAIGLSRLGKKTGWISKVGCDAFGDFIIRELKAESVDVSNVNRCMNSTGIMFKQFNNGLKNTTSVSYYRNHSAASCLSPQDIDDNYIRGSKILHLSGITTVISDSAKDSAFHAYNVAKEKSLLISFDPNIRQKLWNPSNDKQNIVWLLNNSDIALLGLEEAQLLYGTDDVDRIIDILRSNGVSRIAIKDGANGSIVADLKEIYKIPTVEVKEVDSVGAGDAYNSGFLYGVLEGLDIKKCGEIGAVMGACAVSSLGDTDGLPTLCQLNNILDSSLAVLR